jgi:hypothetical protein
METSISLQIIIFAKYRTTKEAAQQTDSLGISMPMLYHADGDLHVRFLALFFLQEIITQVI